MNLDIIFKSWIYYLRNIRFIRFLVMNFDSMADFEEIMRYIPILLLYIPYKSKDLGKRVLLEGPRALVKEPSLHTLCINAAAPLQSSSLRLQHHQEVRCPHFQRRCLADLLR